MQPEIVSTKLYLTVSTGHYRPLIPGKTTEDKWQFVQTELSRFAGRTLTRIGSLRPPLDETGNSMEGQRVTQFLSGELGLNLFASRPAD
jgi:glutaminase